MIESKLVHMSSLWRLAIGFAVSMGLALGIDEAKAQTDKQITILYDAFGAASGLKRDWGFSAFIEYNGRRILFDTGNNAKYFEENVKQLGVDLARLDAVVISHRHGDHTTGLSYVLSVNPAIKVFAPVEASFFKNKTPLVYFKHVPGLPPQMAYYGGDDPQDVVSGSPWNANFEIIRETTEIFPGFYLLTTQSDKVGTKEMWELSLAIKTPAGLAVVVGCSHPGVEKILANATRITPDLYTVTGGFHLVVSPLEEIQNVANELNDRLKIKRVAPAHCTGELGFKTLMSTFGSRFDKMGVGAKVSLP
jgi:7,8-dihydropterin-6-yl-methyl-4-(beta-D-ribofuranosyl)aminobenzene 5'-phosphate synthase